jgi:serine/threonine protein kinase
MSNKLLLFAGSSGNIKSVHQENIIHRDITPSNLIRRETDQQIVLIDFGAVKEISTFTSNSTGEIFIAGDRHQRLYACRTIQSAVYPATLQ